MSVVVEGGAELITSFDAEGLWDECIILTTEHELTTGVKAPNLTGRLIQAKKIGNDLMQVFVADRE